MRETKVPDAAEQQVLEKQGLLVRSSVQVPIQFKTSWTHKEILVFLWTLFPNLFHWFEKGTPERAADGAEEAPDTLATTSPLLLASYTYRIMSVIPLKPQMTGIDVHGIIKRNAKSWLDWRLFLSMCVFIMCLFHYLF